MPELSTGLDVSLNDGRTITGLGFCPQSPTEALRYYRNRLGAAVLEAQDAFTAAGALLEASNQQLSTVRTSIDKLLATNPDTTTPRSLSELSEALGQVEPGATREQLEQQAAASLDLNIVNGVLYPKGATDINSLRALAQSLGISSDNCDLSLLESDEGFILVVSRTETVETVVGSTCGEDIVEFVVVETPIGTNVNIDRIAQAAGVSPDAVTLRLFWMDSVKSDPATLRRLKALGLTAEELGAALMGQSAGRLTGWTVQTTILGELRKRLTDEEICALLSRSDTGGITTEPTDQQLLSTLGAALNVDSLLVLGLVDWLRTFSIATPEINLDPTSAGVGECETIAAMVRESLIALDVLLQQARDFFANLYSALGLGNNQIRSGLDFVTCLASFGLGFDASLNIAIGLPFQFDTFLASFAALLSGVVAAMLSFKFLVCQPQAIIQFLYGGVCGFKPFDFQGCPPSLIDIVDRLQNILNVVLSLVGKVTSATRTMEVDFKYSKFLAVDLKNFNPCVLAATAIALALGLEHDLDGIGTATATVNSTIG